MSNYNGWTNYETWNVALWIGNDEGLYNVARECRDYSEFSCLMRDMGIIGTLDGVSWCASGLNTGELDEMIAELNN